MDELLEKLERKEEFSVTVKSFSYFKYSMRVVFYEDRGLDEPNIIVQAPSRTAEIEDLMELIANLSPSPISGYSDGVLTKLRKDSIIRIYSKDKRVYADTADGAFLIKSPLYQLEETLPRYFVRISNSEIVNSNKILKMDICLTGTILIHLEGDIVSQVSRRYVSKVKEVLM